MAQSRKFASGDVLRVSVPSPTVSDDPVAFGAALSGVALTDYDASDGAATVAFEGVFNVSVKGINAGGNSAVALGDAIYHVANDTPPLSKKATGILFGYALETVSSGATATIAVKLANG